MFKELLKKLDALVSVSEPENGEFDPPAIEVLERVPSRIGRYVMWTIIVLFTCFVVWSFIGEIDEVVVARGRFVPVGYSKVLQAEDKGIVNEIRVRDGQRVKAGEAVLILDRTMSEADLGALKKEREHYNATVNRAMAELENRLFDTKGLAKEEASQQMSLYRSRMAEKSSRLANLNAIIRQKEENVRVCEASLLKYGELLAIAREREAKLKEIADIGAVSKYTYLDYKAKRIELEQNKKMNISELRGAEAEASGARDEKARFLAQWERELRQELLEARNKRDALDESLRKAELKGKLVEIVSPVDGIVHNLAVHTIGAVVSPAQAVAEVVPEGTKLEIEAWVENKDVGFVSTGMPVEVKVDAFDFQKFGTLRGTVKEVSPDAVTNKEKGSVYKMMVDVETGVFSKGGKDLSACPGMSVSAEVKTRKKRVIDFFLEPFRTYKDEALRER